MYCRLLGSELAIIDDATEEATIEGILAKFHSKFSDLHTSQFCIPLTS